MRVPFPQDNETKFVFIWRRERKDFSEWKLIGGVVTEKMAGSIVYVLNNNEEHLYDYSYSETKPPREELY